MEASWTVSAAVREHLRRLCLQEFPCGTGSWNKSRFLPQTWRAWRELIPREEEAVNPGEETVEALLGLVRSPHSPWALLEDSSAEDRFLKELAIQNPLMFKDSFLYTYFRSLRVVDKQVSLVDKDLLKFVKLEELILSANRIKEVNAANLPPTLKIVRPSPSTEQLGEDILEEVIEETEDSVESGPESLSQSGELAESLASGGSAPLPRSTDSAEELAKLRPHLDPRLLPSLGTVLFSTVRKPWADVIPCGYEMQHTLKDLVPLKAFLLSGTTVTIVEEKILSWPVSVPPSPDSPLPAKKGKGEKDKKGKKEKEEKDKKGKDVKDKAGKAEEKEPAKEPKGVKKKKELPKELRQDPPILRVLGSGLVILEPLLAGEPFVSTVCNFGVVRTLETDQLTSARDAKKNKSKKAKKAALEARKTKTKVPALSELKSAVTVNDGDYVPDALTVEVQIQLIQCRSTEEALRTLL